jgi:hypothetical protein
MVLKTSLGDLEKGCVNPQKILDEAASKESYCELNLFTSGKVTSTACGDILAKICFCSVLLKPSQDYNLQALPPSERGLGRRIVELRQRGIDNRSILSSLILARDAFFERVGYALSYEALVDHHHCHVLYDTMINSLEQVKQNCRQ